jgi:DeoR family transcriptional regulator, suf operon transcriptional repressor
MTSTRERILQTLLTSHRSTINDLALAVGINGISVRHHLTNLQADGLVTYEEERHGVGRPRLVYLLTEKGLEHFPTRYLRLTNRLLDQLRETLTQPFVDQIFEQMAARLLSGYSNKIQTLSTYEKLDLIKQLLSAEGFTIEWEKKGNQFLIHEITCPYYHIGKSHPEVCKLDQTLISTVLSIPVEKISCVLRGDTHCTYVIEDYPQLEKVE